MPLVALVCLFISFIISMYFIVSSPCGGADCFYPFYSFLSSKKKTMEKQIDKTVLFMLTMKAQKGFYRYVSAWMCATALIVKTLYSLNLS